MFNSNTLYNIIRSHELNTGSIRFPNHPRSIINEYLNVIKNTGNYRIKYDMYGIKAYAEYWLSNDLESIRTKTWQDPWPDDITHGRYAYITFSFVRPDSRGERLLNNMLSEFRNEFPDKYICYHRLKKNYKFIMFNPKESLCVA